MTDIVERLQGNSASIPAMRDGAAEIRNLRAEIERLRAALSMALEYEPVREDFQSSTKGDRQFAESKKLFSEIRAVLPAPPNQEGGE